MVVRPEQISRFEGSSHTRTEKLLRQIGQGIAVVTSFEQRIRLFSEPHVPELPEPNVPELLESNVPELPG